MSDKLKMACVKALKALWALSTVAALGFSVITWEIARVWVKEDSKWRTEVTQEELRYRKDASEALLREKLESLDRAHWMLTEFREWARMHPEARGLETHLYYMQKSIPHKVEEDHD